MCVCVCVNLFICPSPFLFPQSYSPEPNLFLQLFCSDANFSLAPSLIIYDAPFSSRPISPASPELPLRSPLSPAFTAILKNYPSPFLQPPIRKFLLVILQRSQKSFHKFIFDHFSYRFHPRGCFLHRI